jgi:hypothetical protein
MFACRPPAEFASKFAVFELSDEPAPKTFHEAAEKGNLSMLMKFIERTIDFDINQRVRSSNHAAGVSHGQRQGLKQQRQQRQQQQPAGAPGEPCRRHTV